MHPLSLLYLDEHLAVVNKPAGMLVHRSMIDRRERVYALQVLRDRLGRWVYPLHRIDKATSGALAFALDRDTARRMTESFLNGSISKSYLAVVRGFTKEAERIEHPLKEEQDRMSGRNGDRELPAQDAVTEYRRLATAELPFPLGRYATARYSLIEAAPLTGRRHQIRRHLKHVFHPVVGDTTHGDGRQNVFVRQRFGCHRLLLHSREIAFDHPRTGVRLQVQAPLDDAFGAFLRAMDWSGILPE